MNIPKSINAAISEEWSNMIESIRIDLVKAFKLGLTLKEAAALSLIHQLIQKHQAKHIDLDNQRWWIITGELLSLHSPLVAGHANQGKRLIEALVQKHLLEAKKFQTGAIKRTVIQLKTNTLLLSEPI